MGISVVYSYKPDRMFPIFPLIPHIESPVLSRKSSVTDTYRLDHSEILSDSEPEDEAVEEVINEDDGEGSASADVASSTPRISLDSGQKKSTKEGDRQSTSTSSSASSAALSGSFKKTASTAKDQTPSSKTADGAKTFGVFRDARDSPLDSPIHAGFKSTPRDRGTFCDCDSVCTFLSASQSFSLRLYFTLFVRVTDGIIDR